MHKLITHTHKKKKNAQAGNEWWNLPQKPSQPRNKATTMLGVCYDGDGTPISEMTKAARNESCG